MEQRRLMNVERESEAVTWLVLAMIRLITFAMLVACLLVPLARRTDDEDEDIVERVGLPSLIDVISDEAYRFGNDLGSRDELPQSVALALLLTRIGLVIWCLGLLAVGVTTVELIRSEHLRDKVLVRLAASVLLVGSVLVALGLRWLPLYRSDELGPAWGLWVSAFVAVWVLVLHVRTSQLGEGL